MIIQTPLDYRDNVTTFKGCYFFDDSKSGKRPLVLVAHDWSGCNDFAREKAKKIAELGYVGCAIDMYGEGKTATVNDEKMKLMKPLMDDRILLQKRINLALQAGLELDMVDATKTAAIGFCFGGLCALDLARSGAAIQGVVSFHGILNPSPINKTIHAKILVLHGNDDPMGNHDTVLAFENEMVRAGADWQLYIYGNTQHAFTNPQANDVKLGLMYNALADKRSWLAMKNFLAEIFA